MTLLLTTILNLQGYEIEVIKDYSEFSGVIPSMIILDAGNLETLKGIKTCKDIRNNTAFDNTKIIVTSIYHDKELILSTGADLYIPKPYEISNLLKWVEKLIKN